MPRRQACAAPPRGILGLERYAARSGTNTQYLALACSAVPQKHAAHGSFLPALWSMNHSRSALVPRQEFATMTKRSTSTTQGSSAQGTARHTGVEKTTLPACEADSSGRAKPAASKTADAASERVIAQREALLHRLARLHSAAKGRQGYRTAISLLSRRFLVASQATQIALLQAASFMVDVLEKLPPT